MVECNEIESPVTVEVAILLSPVSAPICVGIAVVVGALHDVHRLLELLHEGRLVQVCREVLEVDLPVLVKVSPAGIVFELFWVSLDLEFGEQSFFALRTKTVFQRVESAEGV